MTNLFFVQADDYIHVGIGLRAVLSVVACNCGYNKPDITVDDVRADEFTAFVELSKVVPTGNPHLDNNRVEGEPSKKRSEAINSAVMHALNLIVASHGVTIVDPSFFVLRDLGICMRAIVDELELLYDNAEGLYRLGKVAAAWVKHLSSKFQDCKQSCCLRAFSKFKGPITVLENYCERVCILVKDMEACRTEGVRTVLLNKIYL